MASSYCSSGIRALRGCRALLAPAKSSAAQVLKTTTTTTTAAHSTSKPKPKPKTSKPKTPKLNPSPIATESKRALGILKPSPISPELQTFLGAPEASRSDAVKQVWSYIKLHNLQVFFFY
jgi:upstream activation factor subunit UAF30